MKMMLMVMLGSALALLAAPAARRHDPHGNLNRIIELVPQYNISSTTHFVEDLSSLTEGTNKCHDVYFCKVYTILEKHDADWNITKNVRAFNRALNVKCGEVLEPLKGSKPASIQVPMRRLLEQLAQCSRYRNYRGPTTSTP